MMNANTLPLLALLLRPCDAVRVRVAIDLSFGAHMNRVEMRSLVAQLTRCVGHNRKAIAPLDLHLTAAACARAEAPECLPPLEHMASWHESGALTIHDSPVEATWDPSMLCWLSPDAEEPLTELDPSMVYVLGGLIDRSVARGASLRRASDSACAVRRLPLREHAPRGDVHPILSLVSCVSILSGVHAGEPWGEAVSHGLPRRYIQRREHEEQQRQAEVRQPEQAPVIPRRSSQ